MYKYDKILGMDRETDNNQTLNTSSNVIFNSINTNLITCGTLTSSTINASSFYVSTLLDANEIHANTIITSLFRANTIYGNSLTLQSDNGGDVPTATPLYLKTLNNQAVKINIPNGYGQTYWEFPDDSRFVGNYMIFGPPDEMSYFIPEFVDGYTYMAYGPSGMQWYSHGEETLVLDAYPNGTTEWHEDGKYDKNLDVLGNILVTGSMGIGVSSPTEKLEISGKLKISDETLSTETVSFEGTSSAGLKLSNASGYITLTPLNGAWAHFYTDRPRFIFNKPIYSLDGYFGSYYTTNVHIMTNTGSERMTILNSNGNVGINNTSPTSKLDVVGNVSFGTGSNKLVYNTDGSLLINGQTGSSLTTSIITSIQYSSSTLQVKTRTLIYTNGVLTSNGTETDWTNV